MDIKTNEIGKLIKKERKEKLKCSQETLGKKINISGKQISNYEKGMLTPPIDILFELCKVFNCELGYLLGEEDYSSKTKFNTAVNDRLGINNKSISAIRYLTGNEKDCISFGYASEEYRRILNNFLSIPEFTNLMESIYELDRLYQIYDETWEKLENTYEKDVVDKALEYYKSSTDYLRDENAEKTDDIYYQALIDIDTSINKNKESSYAMKVYRYEAREAFDRLLDQLYPQK